MDLNNLDMRVSSHSLFNFFSMLVSYWTDYVTPDNLGIMLGRALQKNILLPRWKRLKQAWGEYTKKSSLDTRMIDGGLIFTH
jgi:hypothetical protein